MSSPQVDKETNAGTPNDYSENLYRYYLEVMDKNSAVKSILLEFFGPENSDMISCKTFGYEFNIPVQCAPEIIKRLSLANVAVYQLTRIERAAGEWKR
jgi:hypothetical protein